MRARTSARISPSECYVDAIAHASSPCRRVLRLRHVRFDRLLVDGRHPGRTPSSRHKRSRPRFGRRLRLARAQSLHVSRRRLLRSLGTTLGVRWRPLPMRLLRRRIRERADLRSCRYRRLLRRAFRSRHRGRIDLPPLPDRVATRFMGFGSAGDPLRRYGGKRHVRSAQRDRRALMRLCCACCLSFVSCDTRSGQSRLAVSWLVGGHEVTGTGQECGARDSALEHS